MFLQGHIKVTCGARKAAVKGAEQLKEGLRNAMSESDFGRVTLICQRAADVMFTKFNMRQQGKLEKIQEAVKRSQERKEVNLRPSGLINLSKRQLTTTEKGLIFKGLNFAVTQKIDKIDMVAPIKGTLQMPNASMEELEIA